MSRLCFLAGLALGCADVPLSPEAADDLAARSFVEESAEVLGMLAFVNDADTTLELLDGPVGLDVRAATSIASHSDTFDTLAEVDAQWFVGPSALDRIADWAWANGWVEADPDAVLGSFDGVTFTVAEAEATVALANTATELRLDDELGLDRRAVDSVFAARPVGSVEQLAGLYYVGFSALTALKDEATAESCTRPGAHSERIRDDEGDLWRQQLDAELVDVIDDLGAVDDWCGEAYGSAWMSEVTVDTEDCVFVGATVMLRQMVDPFHGIQLTITFDVTDELDVEAPSCQI